MRIVEPITAECAHCGEVYHGEQIPRYMTEVEIGAGDYIECFDVCRHCVDSFKESRREDCPHCMGSGMVPTSDDVPEGEFPWDDACPHCCKTF